MRIVLLLSAAFVPGMAHAQTADAPTELEREKGDIVVTATRTPLAIEEAPATVTVIDAEDIADNLVTDIKELVRYEPGVSVRRAPARGAQALAYSCRLRWRSRPAAGTSRRCVRHRLGLYEPPDDARLVGIQCPAYGRQRFHTSSASLASVGLGRVCSARRQTGPEEKSRAYAVGLLD